MNLLTLESVLTQLVAWVKSLFVQPDYAQNDSTQPDYIKNRTHYVESVTNDVWYQTGCNVGSGTTSPGGYPATFNITTGDKYNVTISQGSTSKTYEGLTAEYDSVFNGLALRKNWSDSMGMSDTSTDALLLVVQPSNVVLRSADIYGENCTVQVSEVTETIHKLDPKYLPDNVNQLEDITTSKSGKVTTVTFEQTNGTQTQFQVTDGADGTNGKSAYQVAVDNGYSGTEAQWLASLKGADGVSLGEVELTQEVTTATDSVPANKAVYEKVQRLTETDIEDILATGEAKEAALPFGYTELEWIYNENGSSGIDTGLIPNDANWRFVGSWARMKPSGGNWASIFSAYVAEGYNTYRITRYGSSDTQVYVSNHCATSAGKQIALSNTAVDVWHTFDLSYGSVTLDGTTTTLNTTQGTANTATLKLVYSSYYVKFKTFKAYHNDVLVGNFVPAKRDSDGEIGMYDTVTNTFFEHINSNSLAGGPVVGAGKDKILNGEGLSKAIATTLENPNKLPTVQAVKDGIEVWRDDIEYIYKVNDLTFDGTNYVDTGWNPYNPEGDFYIKMEISDLVLARMENNAMIISCCKQISPYPGFAIRRNATNNSQIAVYIDGTGRWNTTVNTGAGSKNTIVFSRVGNVYTFQVNGGVENTFTSTTTYNIDATNLYIGAQLNTDLTTFYRYGRFHLDSLVIVRHEEESVQLYSDYEKNFKIYPKTRANNVEGLSNLLPLPESFMGSLTSTFSLDACPHCNVLNTNAITFIWDAKRIGSNTPGLNDVFTYSDGLATPQNRFTLGFSGGVVDIKTVVNGTTYTKNLGVYGYEVRPLMVAISINFETQSLKVYKNGVFIKTYNFSTTFPEASTLKLAFYTISGEQSNAGKNKRFIIVMNGEMNDDVAYTMWQNYPHNIVPTEYECLDFSAPNNFDMNNVTIGNPGGASVTISDKSETSATFTAAGALPNFRVVTSSISSYMQSHAVFVHCELEVLSGDTVYIQGFGNLGACDVYDENGNLLLKNCKEGNAYLTEAGGKYIISKTITDLHSTYRLRIKSTSTNGCSFRVSNMTIQSIGPVIVFSPYTYKVDYWQMYSGDQIPVGNTLTPLYSLYKPPVLLEASSPDYPWYTGQIKMVNNNAYIGYVYGDTATWKQINNS